MMAFWHHDIKSTVLLLQRLARRGPERAELVEALIDLANSSDLLLVTNYCITNFDYL
jgi:hypothetical protein